MNSAVLCIAPLSSKSEQKKQAVSMFTPMPQKSVAKFSSRGRPVKKGVIVWPHTMELMGHGFFLEGTLGFSRPTHGLEYMGALRHAP